MNRRIAVALIATSATALAGCARYSPRPLDPQEELAALKARSLETYVIERDSDGNSPPAAQAFDPSDGLDEQETVAVALVLNPELKARRLEVKQAQAALITAGLWPNPEVGVGVRPGIDGADGVAVEAEALFELLNPRERDAERKAASAGVQAASAQVIAEELRLVAQVRRARLAVLAGDRTVALLTDEVALRQRALEVIRRQREIGDGTDLDVVVMELDLAASQRELRQAVNDLGVARAELNALMGLPPEFAITLTGVGEPLVISVTEDLADEELDRRVLGGRAELAALQAQYQQAEQQLRAAVLRQYPRLQIGPSFERELEGDMSLGLALGLQLPVLNQNQGEIAERSAERDRIRAQHSALLHQLRSEAMVARQVVRAARAEVDAQEQQVLPLLQRSQELFEGAFAARDVNIIDWITAQQRNAQSRREYLGALVRYREAVIELESALGQPAAAASVAPSTRQN